MGTSWQETSGSSNNILQGKHFAVGGTRSWEIPLKVLLSWSFLTAQQTLPVLCVLGAPHGVRASFLHSCSSSLPEDFRSLASASQDLFPLFLLLLYKHVPVETIFFQLFWGRFNFFSSLSTRQTVLWVPLAAGCGGMAVKQVEILRMQMLSISEVLIEKSEKRAPHIIVNSEKNIELADCKSLL